LRDYGTGAWDGGDPDCDHRMPTGQRQDVGREKVDGFNGPVKAGLAERTYADVCGKCGATRVDQQLGLEPTPEQYVANMVDVFREVKRVLRRDGTCWVNLGDSYRGGGGYAPDAPVNVARREAGSGMDGAFRFSPRVQERQSVKPKVTTGLKPKDLVGIPWRVAFALQADGWYLRSDIVWSKPNPMPESVTDRPTKAHEYVFLLTRSPRYYFDAEAVREQFEARPQQRLTASKDQPLAAARIAAGVQQGNPQGGTHVNHFKVQVETLDGSEGEAPRGPDGRRATYVQGADGSLQHRDGERWPNAGRNVRSVWEIATQPYPEAHFATFPEALPERCIKAGTSERGCCPVCGEPFERQVDRVVPTDVGVRDGAKLQDNVPRHRGGTGRRLGQAYTDQLNANPPQTTGWLPACKHYADPQNWQHLQPVPCTVLDPFMGSGTTALVARRLGRRSIGVELNPDYAALCARRLQQLSLFAGATDG
jgi:DNA modification methylase